MNKNITLVTLSASLVFLQGCIIVDEDEVQVGDGNAAFLAVEPGLTPGIAAHVAHADPINDAWLKAHYSKTEYLVPMRDGVRLHTVVYAPRDDSQAYPMLMHRTPYSAGPYGPGEYRTPRRFHPNEPMIREGFIFVFQDVRGKFMSEGEFVNMTPHVANKRSDRDIDESTDAYDSIEFLLDTVPNHNGRVGMWGISYPGFYSSASMIDAHPNLVAVSPQAPIADWWYDDFHHHGAVFLPHGFNFLTTFGLPRPGPTEDWSPREFEYPTVDGYDFYMEIGPLKNLNGPDYANGRVDFWNKLVEHPNRDEFWEARDIIPHLNNVAPNVMTVGGWFDAEDLYGPLKTYSSIEAKNPGINNTLVMGPWVHGGWARGDGSRIGNVNFGQRPSVFYQRYVEKPFWDQHLKGIGTADIPEALVFETGSNQWRRFDEWPPADMETTELYAREGNALVFEEPPIDEDAFEEFVSDPAKPVPYSEDVSIRMTREYMTDDQRFAGRRPDVIVYQTEPLTEPVTLAGELLADLWVSTSQADADWVVKLIDVHPGLHEDYEGIRTGMRTGGYQMMVRSEIIRGRFRNDPANPEPFIANEPTSVRLPLQDVLHTFKPGHRIMIQIQSSWFPMVDRNPQSWVDNIFLADEEDFVKATHRIHRSASHPTRFEVGVLPNWPPKDRP
ncbi:MAG: CocE/NonD family hydrolase [Planctomycetota bacterium]